MNARALSWFLFVLVGAGCGTPECKVDDPKTCGTGLVCEKIDGTTRALCFAPVLVTGTVKSLGSGAPISGAEVNAVDVAGAPVGTVVKTDTDGTFSVRIESLRKSDLGVPIGRVVSLHVGAQNFLPFPTVVRPAPTVDTSKATLVSGKPTPVVAPDISLQALTEAEQGRPSVSGTVELNGAAAVLVALEGNNRGYTTVPDATGAFRIFNVAAATTYKAQAYSKGTNYVAVDVSAVSGSATSGVALKKGTGTGATISGSVTLSVGANGAGTSVVLALESTFNDQLGRGELVPGLRAPSSGTPNVTGTYSISGIPDGKYVVLVALENDGNVRDPDLSVPYSHVSVTAGVASANPVLKVNGATTVVSPGGGEGLEEVAGTPTFTWKPFAGANGYYLVVTTNEGAKVFERLAIVGIPNADGNITYPYNGPALKTGVIHQWRVLAFNLLTPLSMTEEFRGLFLVK